MEMHGNVRPNNTVTMSGEYNKFRQVTYCYADECVNLSSENAARSSPGPVFSAFGSAEQPDNFWVSWACHTTDKCQ